MSDLRRLVIRYTDGDMTYAEFRREFVSNFLAVRNSDADAQKAVASIECLCADVAEKLITSEAELKEQLLMALPNRLENCSPNPVQFLEVPICKPYSNISSGATSTGSNANTPSFAA